MAIIKCKMCGGDMEISADKTFGTCEYDDPAQGERRAARSSL